MIEIRTDGGRDRFVPGETIRGTASWTLTEAPDAIELRLLWYTEGRGDRDVGIARTVRIEVASAVGSLPFELEAPSGPYSFSGRLISLGWAIEAVAKPGRHTARADVVIAPEGHEVDLSQGASA